MIIFWLSYDSVILMIGWCLDYFMIIISLCYDYVMILLKLCYKFHQEEALDQKLERPQISNTKTCIDSIRQYKREEFAIIFRCKGLSVQKIWVSFPSEIGVNLGILSHALQYGNIIDSCIIESGVATHFLCFNFIHFRLSQFSMVSLPLMFFYFRWYQHSMADIILFQFWLLGLHEH